MSLLLALSAAVMLVSADEAKPDLGKFLYPLSKPLSTPPVAIDVSDFPDGKEWAEKAKGVVEDWYPIVTSLLATEKYTAPK